MQVLHRASKGASGFLEAPYVRERRPAINLDSVPLWFEEPCQDTQ